MVNIVPGFGHKAGAAVSSHMDIDKGSHFSFQFLGDDSELSDFFSFELRSLDRWKWASSS